MAGPGKIAEIFIDLSLHGDKAKAQLSAMRKQVAETVSSINNISLGSVMGMGAAGITVGHSLQQASPDTYKTLTTSFDLLSATIGTALIPAALEVSKIFQGLSQGIAPVARFFRDNRAAGLSLISPTLGLTDVIFEALRGKPAEKPDMANTMPASFQSFEQGWRTIQQQAASNGPLETQLLQVQLDNLQAARDNNQQISFIAQAIRDVMQRFNIPNPFGGNAQ